MTIIVFKPALLKFVLDFDYFAFKQPRLDEQQFKIK